MPGGEDGTEVGTGQGSGSVVEVVTTGGAAVEVTLLEVDVGAGSVVVVGTVEVVLSTVVDEPVVDGAEVVEVVEAVVEVTGSVVEVDTSGAATVTPSSDPLVNQAMPAPDAKPRTVTTTTLTSRRRRPGSSGPSVSELSSEAMSDATVQPGHPAHDIAGRSRRTCLGPATTVAPMIYGRSVDGSWQNRARNVVRNLVGGAIRWGWEAAADVGSIGPGSPRASRFGSFGADTVICFPYAPQINEKHLHLGERTMIGPFVTLSAGWGPGHPNLPDEVVRIGDRCLIGRGSSVIGHESIVIGDDVWTGYDVRITDMNHGYENLDVPIAAQHMEPEPVRIGDGTWLGHHVVVLPGVTIGRHATIGAGSVVTSDIPDFAVAVGVPAKVVRMWTPESGWERSSVLGAPVPTGGGVPSGAAATGVEAVPADESIVEALSQPAGAGLEGLGDLEQL